MEVQIIRNKTVIFDYLLQNAGLHIYEIGDLDDFFWPKTTWYALVDDGTIQSIALLYAGMEVPTLLLFQEGKIDFAFQLLNGIKNMLPIKFYAHLNNGLSEVFGNENVLVRYGSHYRMVLKKNVEKPADTNIQKLTKNNLQGLLDFYTLAYPHNWFDSRMLETHKYYGYFLNNKLVGVAGVHVYSEKYKTAALGNIATHPEYRGKNIGYKVASAVCYDLQTSIDRIGLNVRTNNEYAIRCYEKIGFETISTFDEFCIQIT